MVTTMTLTSNTSSFFSLPSLIRSLVKEARATVGFSLLPENSEKAQQPFPAHPEMHEAHYLDTTQSSGFAETFNSTCGSLRPPGAAGASSGIIQFIGLEGDLEMSYQSFLQPDSTPSGKRFIQSLSLLLTAWGLFVSVDVCKAGDGISPSRLPLSLEQLSRLEQDLQQAVQSLLATLSQVLTSLLNEGDDKGLHTHLSQLTSLLQAFQGYWRMASHSVGLGKPSSPFLTIAVCFCCCVVQWASHLLNQPVCSYESMVERLLLLKDTLLILLDAMDDATSSFNSSCPQLTPAWVGLANLVLRMRDNLGEFCNVAESIEEQEGRTGKHRFLKHAGELAAILQSTLAQASSKLQQYGCHLEGPTSTPPCLNPLLIGLSRACMCIGHFGLYHNHYINSILSSRPLPEWEGG